MSSSQLKAIVKTPVFTTAVLIICFFIQGSMLILLQQSWATIYRCLDEDGITVHTDSPAQLYNCQPIENNSRLKSSSSKPTRAKTPPPRSRATHKRSQRMTRPQVPHQGDPTSRHNEEKQTSSKKKSEGPPPITVRLTKIGGSHVVQARLNQTRDVHLIVDTSATMTVLSYDVATELGLLSGSENDISTVNTARGQVQVSITHVAHMQVGGAEAQNVSVSAHDLPEAISGVSGLLGMTFLKNFVMTVRGLLHLKARE